MKKHPKAAFRFGSAVAIMLAAALLGGMTACQAPPPEEPSEETSALETVTLPAPALPELIDDRQLTDLTPYIQRGESLFAENLPVSASELAYEITQEGEVTITGYKGSEPILVIPAFLEGKPVTSIASEAFAHKGGLRAVSIPDSVVRMGRDVFKGCSDLSSLRTPVYTCEQAPWFGALFGADTYETNGSFVPPTLTTLVLTAGTCIPDYAFYACRGLEVVVLPQTLEELGDFGFYDCESLCYLATEDTVLQTVGERALGGCEELLSLTLPSTVHSMEFGFLEGCGRLESLTIPFPGGRSMSSPLSREEAQAMEEGEPHPARTTGYLGYLFGAASYTFTEGYLPASLQIVSILEGCTDIPANAFFGCSSPREIRLPQSVTSIGRRSFYGCERLSVMTLPEGVVSLGEDAFHGCIRMTRFTGGKALSQLGVQTFMDCLSLTTVVLPDTVTHLPNACFSGCQSLESLTAPGVTAWGAQVFRHCHKLKGWQT